MSKIEWDNLAVMIHLYYYPQTSCNTYNSISQLRKHVTKKCD